MTLITSLALLLYLSILLMIAFVTYERQKKTSSFFVGDRKLNFYITALSAHASDMSSWIFMAFPMAVYLTGFYNLWTAVGLFFFMWVNWQFIAPKLRVETEKYEAVTLSAYFQKKIKDRQGTISVITAVFSFIFYLIYICSGLVGMGLLFEVLFSIPYSVGLVIGILISTFYVFSGGLFTIAWTDFFQGTFLLFALMITPIIALFQNPDLALDLTSIPEKNYNLFSSLLLLFGWGLGYFGQPHILIKFMGIQKPKELKKSKYVGLSWLFLSLSASFLVGLIGRVFFKQLKDPQLVYVLMTREIFPLFIASFILCGVLAAIVSTLNTQILVLSGNFSQDIYKTIINKKASEKHLVWVSRMAIFAIAIAAYLIAYFQIASIYDLVLFAWSGLGATFGPLLIACLYFKKVTKFAAIVGVFTGSILVILFPLLHILETPLLIAFSISLCLIYVLSKLSKKS